MEKPPASTISLPTPRVYTVTHASNTYDFRLFSPASVSKATYYIDNNVLRPSAPDVAVRLGHDSSSPIVAAARFHLFHSDFHACIGDPTDAGKDARPAHFEKVEKLSRGLMHSRYGFALDGAKYMWVRFYSGHGEAEAEASALSMGNMRLVQDEGSEGETVVAVYISASYRSVKKKGTLEVAAGTSVDVERFVVASIMGILEKQRRRRAGSVKTPGRENV
ncbi:hypothetical protein EDC01DRAFT_430506 [Geopyxis carbonaria]|nr:hypothetical protein EDC01DRAFT_430506 [Geopyxis carbonaria]